MNTYIVSQKAMTLPRLPQISLKMVWIFASIIITFLLVFYIFQTNFLVSESYLFQGYQKKLNKASLENETLLINSVEFNSLTNIEEKIKELGFEKADKVYYLQILEGQVATK